ncbi:MAG: hypothetical protein CME70_07330 [Halobacteriovorax sp.]|nr:hypothetical protein [Halobacteriovorax sp.]|tara:strand:+ start:377678 stop:378118 length:441 start_codon:yes stop_codon:yes gene_type:complete
MSVLFYVLVLFIVLLYSRNRNTEDLPSLIIPIVCLLVLIFTMREVSVETILIGSFLIMPTFLYPRAIGDIESKIEKPIMFFVSIFLLFSISILMLYLQDSILIIEGLGKGTFVTPEEIKSIAIGVVCLTIALVFDLVLKKEGKKWS